MTTRSARDPSAQPLDTVRQDAERFTSAWQDGIQAGWDAYSQQAHRAAQLTAALFEPRTVDPERALQVVERITARTGDLLSAQAAVSREWLRAPLWLTGAASPADLPARYLQLLQANGALARAYLDAALVWQRGATAVAASAAATTRDVLDSQAGIVRRVADDVREAQQATAAATRHVADAAQEATSQVVDEARAVAEEAQQRAERERQQAERRADQERQEADRERQKQERARQREQAERERAARAARLIKAKINGDGEHIYHLPGQGGYDRVQADEVFATEDEAQAAGFRRSQARGGGTVKGKVNRDGERIYHLPGQANYDRIEPEMIFETEDQAQANGFRPSER